MKVNISKQDDMRAVVINVISVMLVFTALVSLVIIALFLFNTRGEFVAVFKGEINVSASFYISVVSTIFVSSVLYTPFSFGISNYLLNSKNDTAHISQIFYLFKNPKLLFKSISMSVIKGIIMNVWRVIILFVAVLVECGIFTVSIILSGQNIFDYEQNFLQSVSEFVFSSPLFVTLTIIEWCIVLVLFIYIKIRYIMCKYVLICYPDSGVIQSIRIGEYSISGKVLKTVIFYVKYISIFVFLFLSLGFVRTLRINKSRDSFSTYAVRVTKSGFERYCEDRSVNFL